MEISDHHKSTDHKEYYQTYGSILLNIGHFHYVQCMLRSLTKLLWEVDFEDLCEAVHLVTPKAKFMIEKQTDFRKGMDFIWTARKAKLREIVTPFVKYCKVQNIATNVNNFLLWKKNFVKDKNYISTYEIEKIFGTSLILYLSSMRSNNYDLLRIAKNSFSRLFHVNNNPNYKVLDI